MIEFAEARRRKTVERMDRMEWAEWVEEAVGEEERLGDCEGDGEGERFELGVCGREEEVEWR